MRQVNLNWIKANAYNLNMLRALIQQVRNATEGSGVLYRGWVTDEPEENGVITITGMVSDGEGVVDSPFIYNQAELLAHEKRLADELMGNVCRTAPKPGTKVMATIKTEFNARGDLGVATLQKTDYWPICFAVEWDCTGKISYLAADEYTVVRD